MNVNSNLPIGLDTSIILKLKDSTSDDSILEKLTSVDEKIKFLEASMKQASYLKNHEDLLKKAWSSIDESFNKDLTDAQQQKILSIISSHSIDVRKYLPKNFIIKGQEDMKWKTNRLWFSVQSESISKLMGLKEAQREKGEEKGNEFDLDLPPDAFEILEDFLKTKTLPVLKIEEVAQAILTKAKELGLNQLIEKFAEKCVITPENATFYFELAHFYELDELKQNSLNCLRRHELSLQEALQLNQFAKEKNYKEIEELTFNPLFTILKNQLKMIAQDKPFETKRIIKKKERKLEESLIKKTRSIIEETPATILITHSEGIPEKLLEKLTAQELLILMQLFPESIKQLNLSVYNDHEIEILADYLPKTLEILNLSGTTLKEQTMETISKRCSMVKELNLAESSGWSEDNPLNSSKVSWGGATRFQNLTKLNVSSCNAIAPFLEELLSINAENLEVLKMGNCQLSRPSKDKKMLARLKDKKNAPKEKEFDPGDPSFSDRCLQILAKVGKKLRELDVSDLEISEKSLDALSSNQFIHNNLQVLSLANNQSLNENDLKSLGSNFPNLRSLDLSGVIKLTEPILEEILSKLGEFPNETEEERMSKLEELNIINSGAESNLLPIIKHCPSLKKISLKTGKAEEVEALTSYCPHLISFNASDKISIQALQSLVNQNIHLTELVVEVEDQTDWEMRNDLKSIFSTITKKFPFLETLKIRNIWSSIPEELYQLPYLKKLGLVSRRKEGAKKSLEMVAKYCPQLVELDISPLDSMSSIFDEDLSLLSKLNHLQSLNLNVFVKIRNLDPAKQNNSLEFYRSIFQSMPLKKCRIKSIDGPGASPLLKGILEGAPQLVELKLESWSGENKLVDFASKTMGHIRKMNFLVVSEEEDILKLMTINPRLNEIITLHPPFVMPTPKTSSKEGFDRPKFKTNPEVVFFKRSLNGELIQVINYSSRFRPNNPIPAYPHITLLSTDVKMEYYLPM